MRTRAAPVNRNPIYRFARKMKELLIIGCLHMWFTSSPIEMHEFSVDRSGRDTRHKFTEGQDMVCFSTCWWGGNLFRGLGAYRRAESLIHKEGICQVSDDRCFLSKFHTNTKGCQVFLNCPRRQSENFHKRTGYDTNSIRVSSMNGSMAMVEVKNKDGRAPVHRLE